MTLRSLFVDFNSYFASVEQEVRPELRDRPVAVVPVLADSTCCIAASYSAKACGIRTGTRVSDARALCPGLVLCLARPALYVEWHHRLLEIIGRVLPISHIGSIDEVDCELIGSERRRDKAEALARAIKREIAGTAEFIRCSIGIAPNAFLAKTAADMRKPDGLTVLEAGDLPQALHALALRDLCGIGPALERRLLRHGIRSVAQLTAADAAALRRVWGGVEGERFHALLHGAWLGERPSVRSSVGHSHVLGPELRNAQGARAVLQKLLSKAALRLRRLGLHAGALAVRVRYTGERPRWERDARFADTASTATLLRELRTLLDDPAQPALPGPRGARPLALSVTLHHLSDPADAVPDLFAAPATADALDTTIDRINARFGHNAVYFGGLSAAIRHDAAPMRIPFNRIPDSASEAAQHELWLQSLNRFKVAGQLAHAAAARGRPAKLRTSAAGGPAATGGET
ncbi:MAG: DNA polymerase [Pseudomonadota bacterium]|nr:DNA polymerase [Pseudomonadota bacterium]